MKKATALRIAAHLNKLAKGAEPRMQECGICWELESNFGIEAGTTTDCYKLVEKLSKGWKHHTGLATFPVPMVSEKIGLWEGENARLRRDLCRYMANKLRKQYS